MSYTDYAAQARSYSATASNATRRAERDALLAERTYDAARSARRSAARLTRRPELWHLGEAWDPAAEEAKARTWERVGDIYLRSSWRETAQAAHYRELAARYRAMEADRLARVTRAAAELEAELARIDAAEADDTDEASECAIDPPGQCSGPDCVGWLGEVAAR